jgi:hypothetical protein
MSIANRGPMVERPIPIDREATRTLGASRSFRGLHAVRFDPAHRIDTELEPRGESGSRFGMGRDREIDRAFHITIG